MKVFRASEISQPIGHQPLIELVVVDRLGHAHVDETPADAPFDVAVRPPIRWACGHGWFPAATPIITVSAGAALVGAAFTVGDALLSATMITSPTNSVGPLLLVVSVMAMMLAQTTAWVSLRHER